MKAGKPPFESEISKMPEKGCDKYPALLVVLTAPPPSRPSRFSFAFFAVKLTFLPTRASATLSLSLRTSAVKDNLPPAQSRSPQWH
jgi:hypothetical protein